MIIGKSGEYPSGTVCFSLDWQKITETNPQYIPIKNSVPNFRDLGVPLRYAKFAQNITELNAGDEYLGIQTDFEGMIPGSSLINNMHMWLNLLKRRYPKQLEGVTISRPHYVRHQLYYWTMSLMKREIDILKFIGYFSISSFLKLSPHV